MTVPEPHRSPKAPEDLQWDWADHSPQYTDELIEHGGWRAMVLAHAWHEPGDGSAPPQKKKAYKLPHHRLIDGRVRVVLEGVKSAMNIIAATRFDERYLVKLPADEVRDVYEHLAAHLRQFGQDPPRILKGWSADQGWPPRR